MARNRIADAVDVATAAFGTLEAEKVASVDSTLDVTAYEWAKFQSLKSEAQASGSITVDEALTVYGILGAGYGSANGGWSKSATTAQKYAVTLLVEKMLTQKVAGRR